MPHRSPQILPQSQLVRWLLLAGFWGVVSLILVGHAYIGFRVRGVDYPLSIALFGASVGLSWIPLSRLVDWLARQFPLDSRHWIRNTLLHVGAALGVAGGTVAGLVRIALWFDSAPAGRELTFTAAYVNSFLSTVLIYLSIYAVVVAVVHAHRHYTSSLEYLEKYRQRDLRAAHLERQLAQAQLQALRMQLNPHFLFNTLHAVSSLMSQDIKASRRMLSQLSDLLRFALDQAGDNEVTLDEELQFLKRYLEIEKTRFEDRLSIRLQFPQELLNARVPTLLLQPLVENAIKHGIAPYARKGTVEVKACREEDDLILFVGDDGPGLPSDFVRETKSRGIGLKNTQERLRQLYDEDFEFALNNQPEGGLGITIRLPYRPL